MAKSAQAMDLGLIAAIQEGSEGAFEALVERYQTKVFHLAMRFTRNHEDAEEVLQDVFTTLYRKLDSFQGKSAFSSWLYRIVVNAAFMKLRKKKTQLTTAIEDLSPNIREAILESDSMIDRRSDTLAYNQEIREKLVLAIAKLPEQYRAVFMLRDIDGLSNNEVSEILGLSIPAVKSRLHRSRLMLRRRLKGYYREFLGEDADPRQLAELNAIEQELLAAC